MSEAPRSGTYRAHAGVWGVTPSDYRFAKHVPQQAEKRNPRARPGTTALEGPCLWVLPLREPRAEEGTAVAQT